MKKLFKIFLNAIPVAIMVGLIPYVPNDYLLTSIYVAIIIVALMIKRNKNDLFFLVFGFCVMTLAEYFFIRSGVESFTKKTLLGVMPLWLPFLWSYGFVAIKRAAEILR